MVKGDPMDWIKRREILLNPEASAKELSISRAHLYRLLARGEIKSLLVGRSRRIPVSELEQYVERLAAQQWGEQQQAPG
jgi:excisionase family DNA binding protein